MTEFREKARAVAERGAQERGNYTPSANSVPTRIYNYWAANAPFHKVPANRGRSENFCHFWRVVAIWGPLRWVGNKIGDLLENRAFLATVAAVIVALVAYVMVVSDDVRQVLLTIGALTLGGLALIGLGAFAACMWEEYMPDKVNEWFERNAGKIVLSVAGIALGTVVIIGLVANPAFVGTLLVLGALLGLAGYFIAPRIADFLAGQRALREEEHAEYVRYIASLSHEEYMALKAPKPPGKVAKFFTGIADFIIFVAQVLRVKKYKICPLVTIPKS